MSSLLLRLDPKVDKYLLLEQGEHIVDQVQRHWMVTVFPWLRLVAAGTMFLAALLFDPRVAWVLVFFSFGLAAHAIWRIIEEYRDRFVITNMRVFRVQGNFSQVRAHMPLTRILDTTVEKPVIGRIFGYGHFVFESAAQDQGLRDIRYVPQIDDRDLTIQKVIQLAGLRASMPAQVEDDGT